MVDTQGFPSCKTTPSKPSYWEQVEMKRQINALVLLGKMNSNTFEYACKVILPIKKDDIRHFYGDYKCLNLQTHQDAFLMLLVKDVLTQLG
jgi:hypothetical protein